MFRKLLSVGTFAVLLALTACTSTPTATPGPDAARAATLVADGGWGYGSGGRSGESAEGMMIASADSTTGRGGGAIGSGN